jgi:hypothetical protein
LRGLPLVVSSLVFALLAGCGGSSQWMPLQQGKQWKYLVRQAGQVMTVTVGEPVRVGDLQGRLLTGEGGPSRMAWSGGKLRVSQLSAMRFDPPITLLVPGGDAEWAYAGECTSRAVSENVHARVAQEKTSLDVGGTKRDTLKVTLTTNFHGRSIELVTWFERGVGIIQQEQRDDGRLVSSMTLLSDR